MEQEPNTAELQNAKNNILNDKFLDQMASPMKIQYLNQPVNIQNQNFNNN